MGTTKNIQSIERALGILEALKKEKREMGVQEIARELNLSKSTSFGIINTLANVGYLYQNPVTHKYALGLRLLGLASAVEENNIIIQASKNYLSQVSSQFRETCHCAVEDNGTVIYIAKNEAERSIYINTQIGARNDMYCTGVGKCILAYKTEEQLEKILPAVLKPVTVNTITDKAKLKKNLQYIRSSGFAMDNEEIEMGLTCVAVPVFSNHGTVVAAISISGPTVRLNSNDISAMVATLKNCADKISRDLNM